jgi:hypothetical protein
MNPTRRGFLKGLLASIGAVAASQYTKADETVIEAAPKQVEPVIENTYPHGVWESGYACGTMVAIPRNVSGSLTAYWLG